jgi:3-phosphoshikimate 1-carboxyvinyltransferase
MQFLDLPQLISAAGTVRLPGSKSISNRVLLLAALAEGDTEVRDLLASDDTERMLDALKVLGVGVTHLDGENWLIKGCAGQIPVKQAELFLGNAGTAFRPLTAALALAGGDYILKGVARMHERPIGDLVDGLRQLGADVTYLGNDAYPPLHLKPATIQPGGVVKVRGDVSSQFLTGLLMALPLTGEAATVDVVGELISKPPIFWRWGDWWGVLFELRELVPTHSGRCQILPSACPDGGTDMGPNWMTAKVEGRLVAVDLDCNHIPDAAMTLATAALFAKGTTTLRNIASWRVKETDRIAAMATELRKLGAVVEEGEDFIRVTPATLKPAAIDTYDDHRMAMCFSLAAFGTPLRINDPKCVAKTFPDYFERFAAVSQAAPVIAIDGPSASGKGTRGRGGCDCLRSTSSFPSQISR